MVDGTQRYLGSARMKRKGKKHICPIGVICDRFNDGSYGRPCSHSLPHEEIIIRNGNNACKETCDHAEQDLGIKGVICLNLHR